MGHIQGLVAFTGKPPVRRPLNRSSDPTCAKEQALDAAVIVSHGGLESAFVQVAGALPQGKVPATPVIIDQKNCMYVPRVSGVIRGQPLQIRNSDGTMHNVHAYFDGETEFNLAQPRGARPIERTLAVTDILELKCDVHPWMRGYAVVVAHPYFAVTQAGGAFSIRNVPPGTHSLEVWHPTLGKRTVTTRVQAGKVATPRTSY